MLKFPGRSDNCREKCFELNLDHVQLRYVGQPEMSQKATIVRSCYDIACSNNVVEFLTELGCRLVEGWVY